MTTDQIEDLSKPPSKAEALHALHEVLSNIAIIEDIVKNEWHTMPAQLLNDLREAGIAMPMSAQKRTDDARAE